MHESARVGFWGPRACDPCHETTRRPPLRTLDGCGSCAAPSSCSSLARLDCSSASSSLRFWARSARRWRRLAATSVTALARSRSCGGWRVATIAPRKQECMQRRAATPFPWSCSEGLRQSMAPREVSRSYCTHGRPPLGGLLTALRSARRRPSSSDSRLLAAIWSSNRAWPRRARCGIGHVSQIGHRTRQQLPRRTTQGCAHHALLTCVARSNSVRRLAAPPHLVKDVLLGRHLLLLRLLLARQAGDLGVVHRAAGDLGDEGRGAQSMCVGRARRG